MSEALWRWKDTEAVANISTSVTERIKMSVEKRLRICSTVAMSENILSVTS